jgi:hypothetical protein
MTLYNYFTKLGSVNYNNSIVTNILTSIRFKEAVKQSVTNYYPYTIKEGDRPDTIAQFYYEDERYFWVVLLSNNIIDPYYEWPLGVNDFRKFIIKKYNSIELAQSKTAFYRNAWYNDDSILSPSAYSALSTVRKKYWNSITGFNGNIVSYERKKEDTILETNKIIEVAVNSSNNFIIGENVTQKTSGTITASGSIRLASNNILSLVHINGAFANTGGNIGSIVGSESLASRTISNVDTIYTSIPSDEFVYWEPVSFYDYESELNESRKNIKLIDRQFLQVIEDQMIELLL